MALKVVDCVSEEKRREVLAECNVLRSFCMPNRSDGDVGPETTGSTQHPCLPLFLGAFLERLLVDRGPPAERVWIAIEVQYVLRVY